MENDGRPNHQPDQGNPQRQPSLLDFSIAMINHALEAEASHTMTSDYFQLVRVRMQEEHSPLLILVDGYVALLPEEEKEPFSTYAMIWYDALTQSPLQREMVLEPKHIRVLIDNFSEHAGDQSWFTEKLVQSAPLYTLTVFTSANAIEDQRRRLCSIMAAVVVAMPFILKAEAQQLEEQLFGQDDKVDTE